MRKDQDYVEKLLSESHDADLHELKARIRSGANWFYWIACLSVVNSFITLMDGDLSFIFGLGLTQIVDAFAVGIAESSPDLQGFVTVLAVGIDFLLIGLCALFGFLANRKRVAAFWIGMTLYALDGVIFLAFAEYLSLACHLLALLLMWNGLQALRTLQSLGEAPPALAAISAR